MLSAKQLSKLKAKHDIHNEKLFIAAASRTTRRINKLGIKDLSALNLEKLEFEAFEDAYNGVSETRKLDFRLFVYDNSGSFFKFRNK